MTEPAAPALMEHKIESPKPGPVAHPALPQTPSHWSTRMRIFETNPWSITVMSFLVLGGLGVCVLGAVFTASMILHVVAPGEGPSLTRTLVIAIVVVALEVLVGTVMACLCSLALNHTARLSRGVEVALTGDRGDPAPAGSLGEEAHCSSEASTPDDIPN
ncbi:hypothetical protein ACIRUL_19710 [Streptomyces sp. NPDC101171]|uniref:hypothetical protein n=1 Tax=Streptomyces sp. NPDC101171 TaxID=3366122 RepID=UPI003826D66C